jgi:hypothetical protein
MKFLSELITSLILVALALGAIAGAACTFEGYPNKDVAGVGALAGGFAIAFAIMFHGMMTTEAQEQDTRKESGDQPDA